MTPGYQALCESAAWFILSDRARIRLTGDDRIRLLHALATNVIEGLTPGQDTETFFLSPQGRILARCRVYIDADSVLLETEAVSRQRLLDYLDQYIIMDDVVVQDETEQTSAIALEGPHAQNAFTAEITAGQHVYRSSLTGSTGYWIEVERTGEKALIEKLTSAQITPALPADREAVRVENGIPLYSVDYTESNIPHETQLLDIVSFSKGCYVGQEIVERVKSQGQVNRLLTPLALDAQEVPESLDVLLGDRVVGSLTSAVFSPQQNRILGFAILRREAAAPSAQLTVGGKTAHIRLRP